MKIFSGLSCIVAALVLAAPAVASPSTSFDIPAMPLDQALVRLGEKAGVSIGSNDPAIRAVFGNRVKGRKSLDQALRILLDRSGYAFIILDAQTIRIVRARPLALKPPKPRPPSPPASAPPPLATVPDLPPPEIVVTASKQSQPLANYAGTARIEQIGSIGLTSESGTSVLVGRLPELSATNLGPGRNKIFIRGIADSSFSGPTQSTVGLYLGELRLTYNAPEPDLRYYDIDNIEVIEGPQGTLYGAGALGGIVRIMPTMPDTDGFHARASLGRAMTASGRDSYDSGGTLNVPLVADRVALRLVGYRQLLGGYIDNPLLKQQDTNRTRIQGARAALRIEAGNGWRIDLSGLMQNIDTRDGQYADRGSPELTHSAAIPQPHDNDFAAGNFLLTKNWGNVELVSSTGIVRHNLSDRFDATGAVGTNGVTAYDRDENIRLITHETRLSSRGGNASWVAGVSFVSNKDRIGQAIGAVQAPAQFSRTLNEKTELAAFGEATIPVSAKWAITGGARLVRTQAAGELLLGGTNIEPSRKQFRILPTVAALWKLSDDVQAFTRIQSGFRSGGIAINPMGAVAKFDADKIYTGELGVRFGNAGADAPRRFSGSVSSFYSRWQDIQADLLDANGFPATANIGTGHVFGVEANLAWRPTNALLIESAIFVNQSALDNPAAQVTGLDETSLPNVPRLGGRFSGRFSKPLSPRLTLVLDGTVRYRSASRVGTIPPLLLEQGEYFEADIGAALDAGDWKVTVDVSNVFNARENSFAFGNPFTVARSNQITPLRPRTVRLGISFGF